MFGILIVTHGEMSTGIVDAAEMIVGPQENLEALSLNPKDNVDVLNQKVAEAYGRINKGEGVVVFTDLIGASPFNQSTLAIHNLPKEEQDRVYVLTGVNLPMVLEAVNSNMLQTDIETAVESIRQAGKEGIEEWTIKDMAPQDDDDDF